MQAFFIFCIVAVVYVQSTSISRKHTTLKWPSLGQFNFQDHRGVEVLSRLQYKSIQFSTPTAYTTVLSSYDALHKSSDSDKDIPLVLVHGFDSSCLEFRRLAPLLHQFNSTTRTVYAPDILGWGFGDYRHVDNFSPAAKLAHLREFLVQVVQKPCILVGASLGGGIAINAAVETCPELVKGIVLVDAQAFIDGGGPSPLPDLLLRPLVQVLKSRPLRWLANDLSYRDRRTFATDDALTIGSAHCANPCWDRASMGFIRAGGFQTAKNVGVVKQPTLVIWGRNDRILDPKLYVERFRREMAADALRGVHVIEECGHVPHLEKPEVVAELIHDFVQTHCVGHY